MGICNILYNVNEIVVKPGLECSYIEFSNKLNKYLICRYGKYYLGLQLYESKDNPCVFYVVASYRDIPCVYKAAPKIGNDISDIYDECWGDSVKRNSILSFVNCKRVIS